MLILLTIFFPNYIFQQVNTTGAAQMLPSIVLWPEGFNDAELGATISGSSRQTAYLNTRTNLLLISLLKVSI
jgi:hypothetical protein